MRALGVMASVFAGCVALWFVVYPWIPVRYRLTFEVETPEGLKTGSGVQMASSISYPEFLTLGRNGGHSDVEGEAVPVDLGGRGTMFALFAGRTPDGLPSSGGGIFATRLNEIYHRIKGDWPKDYWQVRKTNWLLL